MLQTTTRVCAAFAAGLVLTILSVGASAQTATPNEIRVGDRWSYDVRDDVTGDIRRNTTITVIDLSDKEMTTRVLWKTGDRPRTIVFDRQWARIDDDIWKFSPNDGHGLRTQLKAGDQWRTEHAARNMRTGTVLNVTGSAKVIGDETVTTSAGTFKTVKVEFDEQQAQGTDASRFSKISVQVWYAPEINRWARKKTVVRIEGRVRESFSEELTDFSRKP